MKNETARREIESLDYYLQNHTDDYSEESHTAMMMAVKALEQEPCDDAISRQEVDEVKELMTDINGDTVYAVKMSAIRQLPPVTPQLKTGHWIADIDKWGDVVTTVNGYRCDKCNVFNTDKDNYCPNCGVKMVEPQKSEDKE